MKEIKDVAYVMVGALLAMAAMGDAKSGKISNRIILSGYWFGLIYLIMTKGPPGITVFLIRGITPIAVLYLLYIIRAVGAGDIKLFSAVSTILEPRVTISIILFSFFIGAGISCYRILRNHELLIRLQNFYNYVSESYSKKRILKYSSLNRKTSYLEFAVCIMWGYIMALIKGLII